MSERKLVARALTTRLIAGKEVEVLLDSHEAAAVLGVHPPTNGPPRANFRRSGRQALAIQPVCDLRLDRSPGGELKQKPLIHGNFGRTALPNRLS